MGFSAVTYAICKGYVNATLDGMGALKGAPCTIKDITPYVDPTSGETLYSIVTFEWKDTAGTSHTSPLKVEDGRGIYKIDYDPYQSTGEYFYYDVTFTDTSQPHASFTIPASSTQMKKKVIDRAAWIVLDPALADKNTMYMVTTSKASVYDQYISVWDEDVSAYIWLSLGSTEIDLTEYQHKIDSNIVKSYKNYDSTTSATQPTAPNVVGAINTFEKALGITYNDTSSTITNLTTTRLPGKFDTLVNAVNQIGKLEDLEMWDASTSTPTNLVDAINISNADYEIAQKATIDRTTLFNKYALQKDDASGSAVSEHGTVEVPRVDLKQSATPATDSYRSWDLYMNNNTVDPSDTSATAFGKISIPTYKLSKVTPVPTTSKTENLIIASTSWTTVGSEAMAEVELAALPVTITSWSLTPTQAGARMGTVTDKIVEIYVTTAPTSDIQLTITYTVDSLAAQYFLDIEGLGYDSTRCGVTIDIDKNSVFKDITLETVVTPDVPYPGAQVGDKYLDFWFVLADGSDKHTYVPCKDLFVAYTGEKAIGINTTTNVISLKIQDPDTVAALTQDTNGLRTYKATRTQYGVVEFATEAEVLAASSTAGKTVGPYDLYNFAANSTSIKGELALGDVYKDSAGEVVNNTITLAFNELSTYKIRELPAAERDSEDVLTYNFESYPVSGVKRQLGDQIHVVKTVLYVDSLTGVADPKDYILYYLTTQEGTNIPGLYMYVGSTWVLVSGSGAIRNVTTLPATDINESVFYQVASAETPIACYSISESDKAKGCYANSVGFYDENGSVTSWSIINNNWSTWASRFISDNSGDITRYTDSTSTIRTAYKHYVAENSLYYRFNSTWKYVGPILYNYIIDADSNIIKNITDASFKQQATTDVDKVFTVDKAGDWSVNYPLMYVEISSVAGAGDSRLMYYLNQDITLTTGEFYKKGIYKYDTTTSKYVMIGGGVANAGAGIDIDKSTNVVSVKYDDITIILNSEGKLNVPIDNKSILVGSDGKLCAFGVTPGDAIEIVDSGSNKVLNVLYDDTTIVLNSEGKLHSEPETFYAEYDVTTFQEIKDAADSGKQVLLVKDDNLFFELTRIDNSGAHFGEQYIVVKYDGTKLLYWGQCDCAKSDSAWTFTSITGMPSLDNQDTSVELLMVNTDNIRVRRANKTILVDSEKKISTDGGIYVPIDEKTILFNDSEQLIAGPFIATSSSSFTDLEKAYKDGRDIVYDEGTRRFVLASLTSNIAEATSVQASGAASSNPDIKVHSASQISGTTVWGTEVYDIQSKLYSSDGSLVFSTSDQGNNCQDIKVNIDNSSITFNSEGKLCSTGVKEGDAIELVDSDGVKTINVLFDDITVKLNSEGKLTATGVKEGDAIELIDSQGIKTINVLFDDSTIKLNSEGKLISTGVKQGEAIELVDSDGVKTINVLYDDVTIKLNSEGKLISTGVKEGEAIELIDSDGVKTINVLYDDITIKLNSEGELVAKTVDAGIANEFVDSNGIKIINVLFDGETIKVDSENKLYVPIDEKTIIVGTDNTIQTRVGGWLEEGTSTVEVCVNGTPTAPTMYQSNWSLTSDFASITDKPDTFNVYLEGEMNLDTIGIVSFSEDVTMTKIAAGNLWDGTLNIGGDTFGVAIINDGLGTDELSLNNNSMHQIFSSNLTASTANIGGSGIIHYIDNDYINIDNSTVILNSEGKLSASVVKEGKAIELVDSGNDKVINVLYDDVTIKLNSEGKLTSTGVKAGEAIELVDSNGIKTINVLYDNSTVALSSEGKLTVPIDNSTIVSDSSGYIAVNIDNKTLLINSEGKLKAVAVAKVDELTTINNSEGEVQAVGLLKDSTININSYGGTNYTDIDISNSGIISYSTSNISHGVHNTVDTQTLNISGGSSFSSGGTIKLSGTSSSDNAGGVFLKANDGTNTFSVTQRPNGNVILTSADDVVVSMSDATRNLAIKGGTTYDDGSSITVSGATDSDAGKLHLYANSAASTYNRLTLAPAGTTTYNTSATEAKVVNNVDTKYLTICGGTSTTGGAVQLYGKTSSTNKGMAQICTSDGTNSQSWLIQPSGTTKVTTSGTSASVVTNDNTHQMVLCGGTSTGNGAYVAIRGKTNTAQAGGIELQAYNGTTKGILKAYPAGQLKWNGNSHGEDEVVTAHGFKIVTGSTSISLSAGSSTDKTVSLAGGTGWAFLCPLPCGSGDGIFSLMVSSYSGVGSTTGSITWVARNNGGNSHSTTIITRGLFVRTDGSYANGY